MTHNKANKSKILALILGLAMCISLMLGIAFASPTFAAYAAGEDGTAPTIVKTGGNDVDRKNHMGKLPNALKGVEYKAKDGSNYKIEATGTEPFTFRANKSGEGYAPLPEGLSLNPTTGEIEGTPTGDAGPYNISVTVTNKYGSDNIYVGMYVYGETSKPKITTTQADIAVGYENSSYSQRIGLQADSSAVDKELYNFRIYFGICKNPTMYMKDISLLNKVSLYIPQGDNLSAIEIFNIFKSTCLNAYSSIQDVIKTLSLLHMSIEKGIIIYECPFVAKVYVFGKDIQNKNTFDLPKGEIIEHITD